MSNHESLTVPLILKNTPESEQVVEATDLASQKLATCQHCGKLANSNGECIRNQQTELCTFCQIPLRAHTNSNERVYNSHLQSAASQSPIHPPEGAIQVQGEIEEYQHVGEPCSAPRGHVESGYAEAGVYQMVGPVAGGLATRSVGRPAAGAGTDSATCGSVTRGSLMANSHAHAHAHAHIEETTVVLPTHGEKLGANLKISAEGQFVVHSFQEHSLGRLLGVQLGDKLRTINGFPHSDYSGLSDALKMRPCKLVFQRRVQISIGISEEQGSLPPFGDLVCGAWCVCCFCNLCCGICAIDEATRAREAYRDGNLVQAHRRNISARNYIAAAVCAGLFVIISQVILLTLTNSW